MKKGNICIHQPPCKGIIFFWQDGYGAFSIGYTLTDDGTKYILHQNEHHKKVVFQDEYRHFLKTYNIEYDERYVWD